MPIQQLIAQLEKDPLSHPTFQWKEGLLTRKGKLVVGTDKALQNQIMGLYHNSALGGYSGMQATAKRLKSVFYWKGQEKMLRQFIRECGGVCQRNKPENVAEAGLLQPNPIPESVFTDITMDFVEGLPNSGGKEVILVVVDRLRKYAHFLALSHPYTAKEVAQVYLDNLFKLHGMPATIISDNEPNFQSNF